MDIRVQTYRSRQSSLGQAKQAQRFAKRPGAGERRSLAIDIGGDYRQIVIRRQKMQWHNDAVIEFSLFRIGGIDGLHHFAHQGH